MNDTSLLRSSRQYASTHSRYNSYGDTNVDMSIFMLLRWCSRARMTCTHSIPSGPVHHRISCIPWTLTYQRAKHPGRDKVRFYQRALDDNDEIGDGNHLPPASAAATSVYCTRFRRLTSPQGCRRKRMRAAPLGLCIESFTLYLATTQQTCRCRHAAGS